MIITYIYDVNALDDDELFQRKLNEVSKERVEKVMKSHFRNDRNLELGVGILLNYAMEQLGNERNAGISYGKNGKPYFIEYPKVHFNLSHAGHYAVCTIADREVGVDIEGDKKCRMNVAKRFFTKNEYQWIQGEEERFFRMWTLKESFLKVTGKGMSLPLNEFEFSFERTCEKNENVHITHALGGQQYYFSEYAVDNYRIAVCSTSNEFEDKVRIVDII